MDIVAVDPGPTYSAVVVLSPEQTVRQVCIDGNERILENTLGQGGGLLAVEMIASYGKPVGRETFETCLWIGRFIQLWDDRRAGPWRLVYRRHIRQYFGVSNDSEMLHTLMARYGRSRQEVMGTKKRPGPLYGIKGDLWQALAVGLYVSDLDRTTPAVVEENLYASIPPDGR